MTSLLPITTLGISIIIQLLPIITYYYVFETGRLAEGSSRRGLCQPGRTSMPSGGRSSSYSPGAGRSRASTCSRSADRAERGGRCARSLSPSLPRSPSLSLTYSLSLSLSLTRSLSHSLSLPLALSPCPPPSPQTPLPPNQNPPSQ